jgi:hypothetical protein
MWIKRNQNSCFIYYKGLMKNRTNLCLGEKLGNSPAFTWVEDKQLPVPYPWLNQRNLPSWTWAENSMPKLEIRFYLVVSHRKARSKRWVSPAWRISKVHRRWFQANLLPSLLLPSNFLRGRKVFLALGGNSGRCIASCSLLSSKRCDGPCKWKTQSQFSHHDCSV